LCHDKLAMKMRAKASGIPITDFVELNPGIELRTIFQKLGTPIVLKRRNLSGSRLQSIHSSEATLATHDLNHCLAEKLIHGKETSVESLVQGGKLLFSNITDYHDHHTINI